MKDVRGYCNTCKKLFCKECMEEHIGHMIMKLEDFCQEKKKSLLSQAPVLALSTQLETMRNLMIKTRRKLQ